MKERMKDTPGPWTYDKRPQFGASDGCEIRTVASRNHTAQLHGPTFIGTAYSEVHARLIASAPDLLSACKNARRFIQAAAEASHFLEGFGPKSTTAEDLELADLDAAIAKAEGRP